MWSARWGGFLRLLFVALYIVLLDVRYIRMQYHLGKREIFRKTLGSEEFRRALREAQRAAQEPTAEQDNTDRHADEEQK